MKFFLFFLLTTISLINLNSVQAQTLFGKIAKKVQQTISKSANTSKSNTSQINNNHNNDNTQQNTSTTKANPVTNTASLPKDSNQNTQSITKDVTNESSKIQPPTWITMDSTDFMMQYPSDWAMTEEEHFGLKIITFSPKNYDSALVQFTLGMMNLSPMYPTDTKSELRQQELSLACGDKDIDDPQFHNVLPDVITDSSVRQTIYKDFKVLKLFFEGKSEDGRTIKSESDIYSLENETIEVGYVCTPSSSYSYFKPIIQTMLKSFQLKYNGALLPEISKNKQPIISHNYIVKTKPKPKPKNSDEDKIYDKVEIEPQFSGGPGGWKKFLRDSLRTDFLQENNAPKGKYAVTVSFVVGWSGISEVKALNDPGYGTAQEAVRLIKSTGAKDGPGFDMAQLNGHMVNCRTKRTITFEVDE